MEQKILFIYTSFSSFVKTDYEILASEHEVIKYHFNSTKGITNTLLSLLKQFFFLLFMGRKFDSFFIWFADTHSFLPVIFSKIYRKKTFVVIGGYDVARIPSLNYGVFNFNLRGFCAAYSMKNSTLNLTVSNYIDRKTRWLTKKQNTKMIYNCANLVPKSNLNLNKENLVITVGLINNKNTFYLKGIDTFIEVSKLLPGIKFAIIGADKEVIEGIIPELPLNLEIIGKTAHNDLVTYYEKAKIYCQFSRSEAFGVAIVEAMNFGCIPVVTNVGGMPEIVEDKNLIVKRNTSVIYRTIEAVVINKKPNSDITNFEMITRKKKLLKTLIMN